jgi:hypothetical protein
MADDETIELLEVWKDGRHYFVLPDGQEIDIPKVEPFNPSDYIFRDGGTE